MHCIPVYLRGMIVTGLADYVYLRGMIVTGLADYAYLGGMIHCDRCVHCRSGSLPDH